jgi:hypothetical protein
MLRRAARAAAGGLAGAAVFAVTVAYAADFVLTHGPHSAGQAAVDRISLIIAVMMMG